MLPNPIRRRLLPALSGPYPGTSASTRYWLYLLFQAGCTTLYVSDLPPVVLPPAMSVRPAFEVAPLRNYLKI